MSVDDGEATPRSQPDRVRFIPPPSEPAVSKQTRSRRGGFPLSTAHTALAVALLAVVAGVVVFFAVRPDPDKRTAASDYVLSTLVSKVCLDREGPVPDISVWTRSKQPVGASMQVDLPSGGVYKVVTEAHSFGKNSDITMVECFDGTGYNYSYAHVAWSADGETYSLNFIP
jgi:hypothetical protein